jgi:hypothetical protein
MTGPLAESQRGVVAGLAILGEWLAGSGRGWQDSSAIWPGIKLIQIQGVATGESDVELGQHFASGATLGIEVIQRRIDDRGGGLARVNGTVRLVEGLALPREEDEAKLGYYNTTTS